MNERARVYRHRPDESRLFPRISDNPEVQRILPLSEAYTWVLISIAFGPKPGYAIPDEVKALSGGSFEIEPENVIAALRNYSSVGLVRQIDPEGSRIKIYHITELGVEVLEAECKRIDFMLELAKRFKSK